MVVVGKMHAISKNEVDIKWTIDNYLFYLMNKYYNHYSPTFFFEGQFWQVKLLPSSVYRDNEYIDVYLVNFSSVTPIKIDFSIALEIADGKKYQEKHCTKVFEYGAYTSCMSSRFISISELSKRPDELAPCGRLTVVCTLKSRKTTEMERDNEITAKCSYCHTTVHAENISTHKKTCQYKDIKCPGCSKVIYLKNWCDHECERPNAEDRKPPEKEFASIAKVIIITAILTACACVYTTNLLSPTNPCAEVFELQTTEVNKEDQSEVAAVTETKVSNSNRAGASKTGESEGLNVVQSAEDDQSEVAEVNESKVSSYNQTDALKTNKPEEVNDLQSAEGSHSEVAEVNECKVSSYNQTDAAGNNKLERVTKLQTAEINKARQSEVATLNESKVSNSNRAGATKLKKSEEVTELQLAEDDQPEVAEVNKSNVSSYNQIEAAKTDKLEPFPKPGLIVADIGSTYIEVLWVLTEDSKTNTARYSVHFRKSHAKWQEISLPDASQSSCNLTNLDPGVLYQIYVTAVGSTGVSKDSEMVTVRTSYEAIYHDQPKTRGKQSVAFAIIIIIIFIVAVCVYTNSETSQPPTHPYGEETKEKTSTEVNDIKDDELEVARSNESKASCSNKSGDTESEESDPQYNQSDDHGFVTDINHLLNEKRGIDVTFVIETPNGQTDIVAHQLILSVMSSYFTDKFYDKQRNKGHQIIPLTGINPKTFEEMIRYCYGYKPDLKTTEEVFALFKVASQFKVINLGNLCCMFFRHAKIQSGNVFSVLEISEEMEDKVLKNMCYKILEEKTKDILASYELCDVSPAMVHVILDLTKLTLNSEYELIKWIFDWAKVKSEENKLNRKSTRCYLEKLLRDMNFLSLTGEEFAMLCKENPDFFSPDEMASISLNIAVPGTREMPDWYDKDTKFRKYTGSKK